MPRQSAEDRAAAAFRAGGAPPEPPTHLDQAAAKLWREIVSSKPADFFDPGACVLLEHFCTLAVDARDVTTSLAQSRRNKAKDMRVWEKRLVFISKALASLATKLRLSVQARLEWHNRRIQERVEAPGADADGSDSNRLLGGSAVWGKKDKAH